MTSMEEKRSGTAPLVLAVLLLLLLPVLYVGSYLALVLPDAALAWSPEGYHYEHYRVADPIARIVYWPLECVDRRVRPNAWRNP
jgi:hypothetical protein